MLSFHVKGIHIQHSLVTGYRIFHCYLSSCWRAQVVVNNNVSFFFKTKQKNVFEPTSSGPTIPRWVLPLSLVVFQKPNSATLRLSAENGCSFVRLGATSAPHALFVDIFHYQISALSALYYPRKQSPKGYVEGKIPISSPRSRLEATLGSWAVLFLAIWLTETAKHDAQRPPARMCYNSNTSQSSYKNFCSVLDIARLCLSTHTISWGSLNAGGRLSIRNSCLHPFCQFSHAQPMSKHWHSWI